MDAVKIGKRLREKRGNRSQKKVSSDTGIGQALLCMYETGKRIPSDERKIILAEYYKTSVQKLFYSP